MKVVLPLPAMPTQTIATGAFEELAVAAGPLGAFEADMLGDVSREDRREDKRALCDAGATQLWREREGLNVAIPRVQTVYLELETKERKG